jgi:uncharacterized membrane protein
MKIDSKHWLLFPITRTIAFCVSVIISGILCGAFIVDITTSKGLDWSIYNKTWTFYAIILLILIVYLYNRKTYSVDQNIRNYMDQEYCRAYLRSECLPDLAFKMNTLVKQGANPQELKNVTDIIEGLLK